MRTYTLTIRDRDNTTLHTEIFACKREVTAIEHANEMFAQMAPSHPSTAKLAYTAGGGAHAKYMYNGTWRNSYHHEKAMAANAATVTASELRFVKFIRRTGGYAEPEPLPACFTDPFARIPVDHSQQIAAETAHKEIWKLIMRLNDAGCGITPSERAAINEKLVS